MLYLGIALMFIAAVAALALYWRAYSRWLDAEGRANDLAAAGAQALESANTWRDAYLALRRQVKPVAKTVFQPMYHAPRGLDDEA